MKALGRGSIASYLKIVLDVLSVALWIGAAVLAFGAMAYLTPLLLAGLRIIDMPAMFAGRLAWQAVVPALAAAAIGIVAALVIVDRLKRLFTSFSSGEPFRRENADHLRVIWIALLVMELGRLGVTMLTGLTLMVAGAPDGAEMKTHLRLDLSSWLVIGVLIVLAEVFREGARLREDQDLTI